MPKRTALLFVLLAANLAPPPTAATDWTFASFSFQRTKKEGKHPKSLTVELPVSKPTGQVAILCRYQTSREVFADRDRGRVTADLEIHKADGSRLAYQERSKVTNGKMDATLRDSNGDVLVLILQPGDIVGCDFSFSKIPRLRKGDTVTAEVFLHRSSVGQAISQNSAEMATAENLKSEWEFFAGASQMLTLDFAKHPKSVATGLLISGKARLVPCVAYRSNAPLPYRGKVIATVTLLRTDETSERLRLKGTRRGRNLVMCGKALDVRKNDRVLTEFKFKKFGLARNVAVTTNLLDRE